MDCSTLSHSLSVSSSVPPGCLYRRDTSSVGTRATLRVMLMRCHCDICMFRKPLITNCPVYTPVMVLLWPAGQDMAVFKICCDTLLAGLLFSLQAI